MTIDRQADGLELETVSDLDRGGLEAWWRRIYRRDPPPRTSRELMVRAVSYHLQKQRHGGLDRKSRRLLEQQAAEPGMGRNSKAQSTRIKPGTRLIREWHGEIHDVLVLEEGFAFRGRIHRSLTAIAREITGTGWNGHRFFGLRRRGEKSLPVTDTAAVCEFPVAEPADG